MDVHLRQKEQPVLKELDRFGTMGGCEHASGERDGGETGETNRSRSIWGFISVPRDAFKPRAQVLTHLCCFHTSLQSATSAVGKVGLLWVELNSPKRYVEGLAPSTSEHDLIWKWDHCKCD